MRRMVLDFEKPLYELEAQLDQLQRRSESGQVDLEDEIERKQDEIRETRRRIYAELTSWQRVQIARHVDRPFMLDYLKHCFEEFVELHGDRHIGDDNAMPGGFATIGGRRCVVVGHQKGRDTKENLMRNFGSAHPEGYRKSLRMMRLGEKFGLPVVALIDTPGAFPGVGAEERNIAEAIAFNLREMMLLRTPIVAVILGEGGSGGALGIGVGDRILMLENSYYSVISPEGCAAILWKHRKHAPEAADALRLTAADLKELGVIDELVPEPEGGAHVDHAAAAKQLRRVLLRTLEELAQIPLDQIVEARYRKFRGFGSFREEGA
ncbi:MAG TPA: acetyl-CoA carboxylase carboxyltransferase subunit alpha [Verrucomicrobiales bacterium]|nr:acetyl-CoA carboxylase carboxyltransferase subunit alpha [Verrucomicrobiales bacterium]